MNAGAGYPVELIHRPDLQQLVDAGLDRRTGPLIAALRDSDPAVRATAAHALASVQDPAARAHLATLLGDQHAAVRANAAFAIGQLADSSDATTLIDALRTETVPMVRLALLEAAGKGGGAGALMQILEMYRDTRRDRDGLALALFHFARRGVTSPQGAATLLTLLREQDDRTAMLAALALAAPRTRAGWGVSAHALRDALAALRTDGRAAAPLLRLLARSNDAADLYVLRHWLADGGHWTSRTAAAAALGQLDAAAASDNAIAALLRTLDDPSPHVAGVAAEALVALRARAPRAAHPSDGLDPGVWAEWVRAHPERAAVAALLLPGLVGTAHESLVLEWATGRFAADVPRALAWPALARIASSAADSLLVAGLLGARRDAYAAAAALAQRLADVPPDAAQRAELIPLLTRRLHVWGPLAPGSDLRGVLRLMQELAAPAPARARPLLDAAARHPHPEIRAAAVRYGAATEPITAATRRPVNWPLLQAVGARPCLAFTTERGSFTVELLPEAAPLAVSALLEWAAAGSYDDLTFHRVEPDFILQSGDFDNADGYGGPAHGLRSEFSQLHFAPGVLGVASSGKDTEGSQFFITHNHAPSLDGRYSAVGRVVAGHDVADDVALGAALVTVSLFGRAEDITRDERSPRCTSREN